MIRDTIERPAFPSDLDLHLQMTGEETDTASAIFHHSLNFFPEPKVLRQRVKDFDFRGWVEAHGMYTLIDEATCQGLAYALKGLNVLEPFAGRGWLTMGLRNEGIHIVGGDIAPPPDALCSILKVPASSLIEMGRDSFDVLLMASPPVGPDVVCNWRGLGKPIIVVDHMEEDIPIAGVDTSARFNLPIQWDYDMRPSRIGVGHWWQYDASETGLAIIGRLRTQFEEVKA